MAELKYQTSALEMAWRLSYEKSHQRKQTFSRSLHHGAGLALYTSYIPLRGGVITGIRGHRSDGSRFRALASEIIPQSPALAPSNFEVRVVTAHYHIGICLYDVIPI